MRLIRTVLVVLVVAACSAPPSPTDRPPPDRPPVGFAGAVFPVDAATLGDTWRPGCPVGPDQLVLLRLRHWGFDGRTHEGALIVHRALAGEVIAIFRTLHDERFPIRRMVPVDAYDGSDDASMAADNTSGFNCRRAVTTGRDGWSRHAYGSAIDINPVENPYLVAGRVLPPAGAAFRDRTRQRPGMVLPGGAAARAFAAAGWRWGGDWSAPDYQHFDTPPRDPTHPSDQPPGGVDHAVVVVIRVHKCGETPESGAITA